MSCLFFDIDGTILSHDIGLIPGAIKAITQARENGHTCFIATGRHLNALSSIEGVPYDGVIFCNGAGIYYHDQILETSPIPHDIVQKTLIQAEEKAGAYTVMSSYISFKNEKEMKRTEEMVKKDPRFRTLAERMKYLGASDFEAYRHEDILKIDIGFDSEEIMNDFMAHMDPSLHLAATAGFHVNEGRRSGEITRQDVNKGSAIIRVVQMLGMDMNDTFGFGDSGNDVEMLETCAVGTAMGNASDDVKQKADCVTDTVENDGVYKAMKAYGLI